ncbi:hypothetical protein V6R21_09960 [Limibacter armeniacum]|uniref:hypothetical protein n=1 Tax=Limibacter armeniacum TaxID=466084 RepID=UPI002FE5B8BA
MKALYAYRKDFFHIYTGVLDNKETLDHTIQVIIDVIQDYLKTPQSVFLNTAIYKNFKQIEDSENSYNEAFWSIVANFPPCHNKAEEYLVFVLEILKNEKSDIWENDASQLGQQAAYHLALADKRFIQYYAQLLEVWDMAHEVDQAEEIDEIIDKYEWCPEIEELIFIRSTCRGAIGQHGREQFEQLSDLIVKHSEPLEENAFFRRLVSAYFRGYSKETIAKMDFNPRLIEAALNTIKVE